MVLYLLLLLTIKVKVLFIL